MRGAKAKSLIEVVRGGTSRRHIQARGSSLHRSPAACGSPGAKHAGWRRRLFVTVSALATMALPAQAQVVWEGNTSTDWFTSSNWDTGVVPTAADDVQIDTTVPNPTVVNGGNAAAVILTVGDGGTGELTIENGGAVSDTVGIVGEGAGSQGTVTVTGMGSTWANTAQIQVGAPFGTGTLTIADGGTVSDTVGLVGGSEGTVTVTGMGSTWDNSQIVSVGINGTGTLSIADGGTVFNTDGFVGTNAGGEGVVTVSGAGSSWNNSGDLAIGNLGNGELTIAAGALVFNSGIGSVGADPGSAGVVTVSGAGWFNDLLLFVGEEGTGTLTVADSGVVVSEGGIVGFIPGSEGTVTVTGTGSTWDASGGNGGLTTGLDSTGTLTVEDGGAVSSQIGMIGINPTSQGTVTVTGAGSSWTNTADLFVGSGGTGTLTIADGGIVSAGGTVFVANSAGSTGTVNIGAAAGDAAVAPGTLDTTSVEFGDGTGALNFNHTASDYLFAPAITGPGAVNVHAGTTMFDNDKTYTGPTTVDGGALIVNGSIAASSLLTVNAGGLVGGTGTLPSTTVNGGTLSPGNSIGTINVQGDLALSSATTYLVEVSPAAADRTNVSGTADLAGTVQVLAAPGSYAPNTTYTILNAAAGANGTFDTLSSNVGSVFLVPTLDYDPNNVYLTLARLPFTSVGLTRNQIATAKGVESLGFGNPVFDAVLALGSAGEARFAFDQLSGEIHASAKTALVEESRFVREAATNRIRAAFGDSAVARSMPVLAYGPDGLAPAPADTDHFAAWGQGFGSWGETDSDGNAAKLERSIGGFFLGADALVAESWRLGLIAGYSRSSFDVDDRASSGDSDNYHLGVYGGTQWGALGLRAGAAYSWHDIDTDRTAAFAGFADTLQADYDAGTGQVFGELGYRIDTALAALEPFAGLAYVNLDSDGFSEDGGAATLTAHGGSTDTTFTTLGVRASRGFLLGSVNATARGMLGWRHAFGDVTPLSTHAFAAGDAFTIAGVPIAEDAAVIEAGLDLALTDTATFGISYNGQIAEDAQDHGLWANLAVRF